MSEYDVICDHAEICRKAKDSFSDPERCSAKHPHRYNHEECNGINCPHACGVWVKCVQLYINNPELNRVGPK